MATNPPHRRHGCRVCGRSTPCGFPLCFCCTTIVEQLRLPLVPVVAMTDYRIGGRMHGLLRGYKDAPSREARAARTSALAALVALWLDANEDRVRARFGAGWDLVATVPSSRGRAGSPAAALVDRVPPLAELDRALLVRGDDRLGHLVASRRGFVLSSALERSALGTRRVLVFDDTMTTGARAQSAAAALREGGVRVTGILVVGRALGAGARGHHLAPHGAAKSGLG
jgi:predicted amidophosphoribosyltransferase